MRLFERSRTNGGARLDGLTRLGGAVVRVNGVAVVSGTCLVEDFVLETIVLVVSVIGSFVSGETARRTSKKRNGF